MLQLTAEEIALLLKVSEMDIYSDWSGGPDQSWRSCPLCSGLISEDDYVKNYITKEAFDRDILPTISDYLKEQYSPYLYENIRGYELDSEEQKKIPFPHKEGCEIEALRALHKKMKDFQDKESSE
jgi:hypothetical protein